MKLFASYLICRTQKEYKSNKSPTLKPYKSKYFIERIQEHFGFTKTDKTIYENMFKDAQKKDFSFQIFTKYFFDIAFSQKIKESEKLVAIPLLFLLETIFTTFTTLISQEST